MNVSRTEKALVGLGVIELVALGSYVFGFLSGPLALILFILGNVGWVAVMRLTHPRLQHLAPLDRLGLGGPVDAPVVDPDTGVAGGALPRTPSGTRAPRPVDLPPEPEAQAALVAERQARERARLEEQGRIRDAREAAKAAERERRESERAEADAARRAAVAERAEQEAAARAERAEQAAQARLEAERRAAAEQAEQERLEAERKAKADEERQALLAEEARLKELIAAEERERQRLEDEARARREADERAMREAEEAAAAAAEQRRRLEQQALARQQAERDAQARRAAEERARREAEAREAEERATRDAAREAAARAAHEQAERDDAGGSAPADVIDWKAVQSDQDILAASDVASIDTPGESDAEIEARDKQRLLDKVRLRLSDYE